ncbi:MAG: type II secretion system protein [Candidatus Nomurabacteria bacterium]|nr:type II secretion system protein [Candidatus Nomurabacteria bacterium]
MINKHYKNQNGYSLIETVFYIVLFSILSLAVINALISMTKSFTETATHAELMQVSPVIERITHEIRQATSITSITNNNTDLLLQTTGTNTSVEFLLSGTNVQLKENGATTGNLNTPDIAITGLTFTQITSTNSKAVKVDISARYLKDKQAREEHFYDTVILRGSY